MYERRVAIVEGLRISYITAGSSYNTIIFIHGLGGRAEAWLYQVKTLSTMLRTIAIDLRGFGMSERPPTTPGTIDFARDILGVMDWEGVDAAVITGSSMGGMVALRLYEIAEDRIRALALSNTSPRIKINLTLLRKALLEKDRDAQARIVRRLGSRRLAGLLSGSPHYILRVADKVQAEDLTHIPARITKPTLLIGGELDPITPPHELANLHSTLQSSTLKILSGAGHLAHIQKPREYTNLLIEFISKFT